MILIDPDEGLETVLHAAVISGQFGIPAFAEMMFLTNIAAGVIMQKNEYQIRRHLMTSKAPRSVTLKEHDVLLCVDVQNCFLPGGTLGITEADRIIDPINNLIRIFRRRTHPVFFTRDWHPSDHCSFMNQGGPWPPHGIQETEDAAFSSRLEIPGNAAILSKGTHKKIEQYSTMHAHEEGGWTLTEILREAKIKRIFIGGLATDYCVLNSVRDARKEGFEVFVMTDTVCAVDVAPGDGYKALAKMEALGAQLITSDAVKE
jgi:nicotinamidase/pyrazinamidase